MDMAVFLLSLLMLMRAIMASGLDMAYIYPPICSYVGLARIDMASCGLESIWQ